MLKIENNYLDHYLASVVILLMSIGTVFVFSASAEITHQFEFQKFYDFPGSKQMLFFPIAIIIMFAFSFIDYRGIQLRRNIFKSPITYLLILSLILLILVLIPRIGTQINYARRWLRLPVGPITVSFQPSELAKWAVIFFVTAFCCRFKSSLHLYWKRFIPICAIIGVTVGLILIEDFGTAAFISMLTFLMLVIAGVKFSHILTLLPFGLIGFCAAILTSKAKTMRIIAFLNPEKWADSASYQANQSLIALGSGGPLGKGLGRGICKYGHLPEDTTDFIFAIIGEELGFVGTIAVIILFIIFIYLGLLVITRCSDTFGQLLAAAIVLTIAVQAAINIGVVTVVLPTKGIPLPFVSSGGTSLLLCAAAAGILLNIAKQTADEVYDG